MKKQSTSRADGRLVKSITDPRTGRRVYFYGKTEREIFKKILEYQEKNDGNNKTFKQVSDEWWDEAQDKLAFQTLVGYKTAKKRADGYFANALIKNIKPKDINQFLKTLARQQYAFKTLNNQKLICSLIFKHAVFENYIEYNPCTTVEIPHNTGKMQRSAAKTDEENIVKNSHDIWLFPYIALMTGMRKGEILALKWKDIDFENNIINVSKSVYHEYGRPKIKEPKTKAGIRTVPLLPKAKAVLNEYRTNPDEYIISDNGKTPLTSRRYQTLMRKYQEATGVTCTAHQLRHSFATIAFECGIPVKSVQEVLGHRQLSTTMDIYTDFRKKSFNEFSALMEKGL